MKNKRFPALLLAILMLISLIPAQAFADEAEGGIEEIDVNVGGDDFTSQDDPNETERIPISDEDTHIASGTCGEELSWVLDEDGTLTVSGTGAMNNFYSDNGITSAPWGTYYASIKAVVIENSVTDIGESAFYGCISLASVTIPDSVTSIGGYALEGCAVLSEVSYAGSELQWNSIDINNEGNDALISAEKHFAAVNEGSCGEGLTWTLSGSGTLTVFGTGAMDDYTEVSTPWVEYNGNIKIVVIEQGVTYIGSHAFSECSAAEEIDFNGTKAAFDALPKGENWNSTDNIVYLVHVTATDEAVPADCTHAGLSEGSHCSDCGEVFTAQETVDALGHSTQYYKAKDPGFGVEGNIEYRYCLRCEKYFSDEACTVEITPEETVIPARTGYSIRYELNGGVNDPANPIEICSETATVTLAKPTRDGYTFAGWYKDEAFKASASAPQINGILTSDLTFYAKWTPIKYTIKYNLNGGTNPGGMPSSFTAETPETALSAPTKKGNTFVGWFADAEMTVPVEAIGGGMIGNLNLYALWEEIVYTVSYDTGDGVNDSANASEYTVTTPTVKLLNPSVNPAGYSFAGWYNSATNKSVTSISKGSVGNIELYAKWSIVKYTVKYNLNGGTNAKGQPTYYYVYTEATELSVPTKKGNIFTGWYTDKELTLPIDSVGGGITGNLNLYAGWEEIVYTISYDTGDGVNDPTNASEYTVTTPTVKLLNPSVNPAGYSFAGWYNSATNRKITSISKGTIGSIELYARWSTVKYTVKYNLNGGTNAKGQPTYYYVETPETALLTPTRKGYAFTGWYLDAEKTVPVDAIGGGMTGNLVLYADWDIITYTVSYETGRGANDPANVSEYTVITPTIKLLSPALIPEGYTFGGWYNSATNRKVTSISKGSVGNLELSAKWNPIKYTVKYNLNGGTNPKGQLTAYYEYTESTTLLTPSKKGYSFAGWYTDKELAQPFDGYIGGGMIGNLSLYAKWQPVVYTLSYFANGGTEDIGNPASYTIENAAIKLINPTRPGYTFAGWYNSATNKKVTSISKGSIGDMTLYAKWTPVKYTVKYVLNGGTNAKGQLSSYTVETAETELLAPTRSGFDFKGWFADKDFSEPVEKIAGGFMENLTLYAKWEKSITVYSADGGNVDLGG